MTTRERITAVILAVVIAINVAVAAALGIATSETNPLLYLGFAIPVAVLGWMLWGIVRGARTRERARAAGTRGRIRVLSASELLGGVVTVNQQPLLRLELELEVPGRPTERFSRRMLVPRLAVPAVMSGESFDVLVDPANPRRFEVSW
jgi:hypothetical protein